MNDTGVHEGLIEALQRNMPQEWEASEGSAESICLDYVRTLEQRVISLGGTLDRHPEPADPLRPQVVTLVGSTRFRPDFDRVMRELTLAGHIVIGPGVWWAGDHEYASPEQAKAVKEALDELHLRKIDVADVVMVINLGGYIGESTAREIAYARANAKTIVFAYPQDPPGRQLNRVHQFRNDGAGCCGECEEPYDRCMSEQGRPLPTVGFDANGCANC